MRKNFSYVAGSAACAALILLSGCQQTTDQLSNITRYVEEKIAEGKGTEVKSKEQETDTEQAAVCGETEKQAEPSVEKQSVDCYVYQTLPEEVRTVYDEVYDAILYEKEDVALSTLDNEVLHQAYVSVMADHGGLFWVSGYTYTQYTRGEKLVDLHFTPKFTMTDAERMDMQAQIDETVSQILAGIDAQAPDYDKANMCLIIWLRMLRTAQVRRTIRTSSVCLSMGKRFVRDTLQQRSIFWKNWTFPVQWWPNGRRTVSCMESGKAGWRVLLH